MRSIRFARRSMPDGSTPYARLGDGPAARGGLTGSAGNAGSGGRAAGIASAGRSAASVRALVVDTLRDPAGVVRLPPRDLDLLLRLLRRAQLLARVGWQLREAGLLESLPRAAADQLVGALALAEAQRRAALWEVDRIVHALRDDPPQPLVVLKGCAYALAELPNARGRLFADVDLLVARAQLESVEARLLDRGWVGEELVEHDDRYYRAWSHELPPIRHAERDVEVDLHHNIVMATGRAKPDARLLLADARALPGTTLHVLSPVDTVLHAMAHLMAGSALADALRELVDIDQLLRHFSANEPGFWESLWPRAEALDLARPAFHALRQTQRLLGTPIPPEVLAAAHRAAPPAPLVAVADRLMPLALFPFPPDRPARAAQAARTLLFLRSHWIRMPATMLARHLANKQWRRWRPEAPQRDR